MVAGVAGFIPAMVVQQNAPAIPLTVPVASGYLLGIFPVNALHDVVHIALGAWGVVASMNALQARTFARMMAIVYGALTVCGLVPVLSTLFGLLPVFGNDVWLHALSALVAAYAGWGVVRR